MGCSPGGCTSKGCTPKGCTSGECTSEGCVYGENTSNSLRITSGGVWRMYF